MSLKVIFLYHIKIVYCGLMLLHDIKIMYGGLMEYATLYGYHVLVINMIFTTVFYMIKLAGLHLMKGATNIGFSLFIKP